MKSGSRKSRLSGVLSAGQREEFARLMLVEVLEVLRGARLLRSSFVVSPDRTMLDLAERLGSRTVPEPGDMGVNSAVRTALRALRDGSDVLVIPADLPLLKASDLEKLFRIRSDGTDAVIAPSLGFDGTNALLFGRASDFPLSYDDHSFWNHIAGAASAGLKVGVCTEAGLTFDVDSPDDFRALARSSANGPPAGFARRVLG